MLNSKFKDIQRMQTNTQQGLTLIELLITMALGVLVIMGASRAMLAMNSSSKIQSDKNALGQTAEIAFAYIGQQLRNSLAAPCERFHHANNNKQLRVHSLAGLGGSDKGLTASEAEALIKSHGIAVDTKATAIGTTASSHTDNLLLFTTGKTVSIKGKTDVVSPTVAIPMKNNPFDENDRVFALSTCENIDVFKVTQKPEKNATTNLMTFIPDIGASGQMSVNYRQTDAAILSPLAVSKFSVANRKLNAITLDATTSNKTLLNNVESMRVIFGVDAIGDDGVIDKYITASELSDLSAKAQLVSVDLYLLIAASDVKNDMGNIDMPNSYKINLPDTKRNFGSGVVSETLTFEDRVLRKVFKHTITLRNTAGL